MPYENYFGTDFIKDDFFVRWVLEPDEETNRYWKAWISDHPEKEREINQARCFLEKLHYEDRYKLSDEAFSGIHENIIRFKKIQDVPNQTGRRYLTPAFWGSVAAAVLILAIVFGAMQYFDEHESSNPISYIIKETPAGMKQTIELPDGTKVKLNSKSSIRFPKTFKGDKREVYFEGEAFFDVTKSPEKPFIIHSNNLKTQVIGTSFNLHSYRNNSIHKIAVVTGLVKVDATNGKSVTVSRKQMAIYKADVQDLATDHFDVKQELGWKDGLLYFHDTRLGDVFKRLEAWYGVQISISKDLPLGDIYNGEFDNETLDNVLSGIGYTSGFTHVIKEKKVWIHKNKK